MQSKPDFQLIREYVQEGSEAAFGELVARYTNLIYSAAVRQVGSPDLARDVAQCVFSDLAQKAPMLLRKSGKHASLVNWLYRSSRFVAAKYQRSAYRRHTRE